MKNRMLNIIVMAMSLVTVQMYAETNDTIEVETDLVLAVPKPGQAEFTLTDDSKINGKLTDSSLPFITSFGQKLTIPIAELSSLEFNHKEESVIASLMNGDRLTGHLDQQMLAVSTIIGDFQVNMSDVRKIQFVHHGKASHEGLIYWNKFESAEATGKPQIGPISDLHSGEFVTGKSGMGLKTTDSSNNSMSIDLPKGTLGNKGCIEFWAKIDGSPVIEMSYTSGPNPRFFTLSTRQGLFWLEYNNNNGHGMGGLCSVVSAVPYGIADSFSRSQTPHLGVLDSEPYGWHHYAVIWNDEGIEGVHTFNKEIATFATLLDGKVYAARNFEGSSKRFQSIKEGSSKFDLGVPSPNATRLNSLRFVIDDLKIWNYDKTKFDLK